MFLLCKIRQHAAFCALCVLCLFLASCASKPKSTVRGTKPYTVRGEKYYPLQTAYGYDEEGIASWYGPGFHGKKTANGETFNQNAMTAAHTLLPLGTTVRVTNLENDKSITVRINDRGPFVHDRLIDLSRRAAERLDMREQGTARVRVVSVGEYEKPEDVLATAAPKAAEALMPENTQEDMPENIEEFFEEGANIEEIYDQKENVENVIQKVIHEDDPVALGLALAAQSDDFPEIPDGNGAYYVQFGAFEVKKFASLTARKLVDLGFQAKSHKDYVNNIWRVRVGPLQDASMASETLVKVQDLHGDAKIIVEADE